MTRLTRDTAFRLMFHSHMTPNMLTRIIAIVRVTTTADHNSKPNKTVVTKVAGPGMKLKCNILLHHFVYCKTDN